MPEKPHDAATHTLIDQRILPDLSDILRASQKRLVRCLRGGFRGKVGANPFSGLLPVTRRLHSLCPPEILLRASGFT